MVVVVVVCVCVSVCVCVCLCVCVCVCVVISPGFYLSIYIGSGVWGGGGGKKGTREMLPSHPASPRKNILDDGCNFCKKDIRLNK